MKRFMVLFIAFMVSLSYASCVSDDGLGHVYPSYDTRSGFSETSTIEESEIEIVLEWEDFPDYTKDIPKPDFITGSPLRVNVAGEVVLTFSSDEDTDANRLRHYLEGLQNVGYDLVLDCETEDVFYGKVCKDGCVVMEYTYRYGLILLDVFKNC